MNYRDLFIAAMNAEEYKRTAWVISAFSLINEGPEEWKSFAYPYRIVQTPGGHFYVDPQDTSQLLPIEGAKAGQPPFRLMESIDLPAKTFINQPDAVTTTYGNVLINHIVLIYPFGNKIKFKTGRFTVEEIENFTAPRLTKNPPEGEERDPQLFYVDERLKFANAAFALGAYTQLCVPAHTEKMMVVPPGTKELRQSLLKQFKDRLHDPAVVAEIDKQLIAHYREWIKGDRSEGFLITKKSIETVRKKLFLMHGAEMSLMETMDVDLITNSLREGWSVDKFSTMINSLRAGSYNRGQQTELGGVVFKDLLRASANIRLLEEDCGTKLGLDFIGTEKTKHQLIGYNAIGDDGKITQIDESNYGQYLGKKVKLRTPMYCKHPFTDYCTTCVGRNLTRTPTAISVAISDYGSVFLSIFLKSFHGKSLTTQKLDWKGLIR